MRPCPLLHFLLFALPFTSPAPLTSPDQDRHPELIATTNERTGVAPLADRRLSSDVRRSLPLLNLRSSNGKRGSQRCCRPSGKIDCPPNEAQEVNREVFWAPSSDETSRTNIFEDDNKGDHNAVGILTSRSLTEKRVYEDPYPSPPSSDDESMDEESDDDESMNDDTDDDGHETFPQRQPLSPEQYTTHAHHGSQFSAFLDIPSVPALETALQHAGLLHAGQSSQASYTNDPRGEMEQNGWTRGGTNLQIRDIPIMDALKDLNIAVPEKHDSNQAGDFQTMKWDQDRRKWNGKTHAQATGGEYTNIYNTKAGLIIAFYSLAPNYALYDSLLEKHDGDIDETKKAFNAIEPLPHLSKLSDIQFLDYNTIASTHTNQSPKDMRYVLFPVCQTPLTNGIVDKILEENHFHPTADPHQNHNNQISRYISPPWKSRLVLRPGSKAFNAALNTPEGMGVVYLLLQHRNQMGFKRVKTISVWDDNDPNTPYSGPSLLFEFEQVPRNTGH